MGKNKVTPLSELSQEDLLAKATELEASNQEKDATIEELEAAAVEAAETIEKQKATIEELIGQNEVKDATIKSKRPVVKIGKSTHGLKVPKFNVRYNGEMVLVDAAVLNENKELAAWLLENKPNLFTKLK